MCRGVNDECEAVLPHYLQQVRSSPRKGQSCCRKCGRTAAGSAADRALD